MICRTCGTDIADKALICYRCGTATTEAKFKPPAAGRRGVPRAVIAVIIAALLVLLAFFLLHSRGLTTTGAAPERFGPQVQQLQQVEAVQQVVQVELPGCLCRADRTMAAHTMRRLVPQ